LTIPQLQTDESALIDAIVRRDELAFVQLVRRYQGQLLRLARVYARSDAVAQDIVQDTWLGVLQGIERFERRSSFKTWLFRILVNRARTRAQREGRMVPFAARGDESESLAAAEPAVPAERFLGPDHPEWPYHWAVPPKAWDSPEQQLLTQETLEFVDRAIADLPPAQREVITLRDVQGWTAEEVCNVLEITETNQRVLLHRARSRVRAALERHFDREPQP
jgi:RNA polymerase sigma-70 factor, ECF subfamily